MLFSTLNFILVFLPALLALYFAIPRKHLRLRRYVLLAFSLVFYGWGEPRFIFVILALIALTYALSRAIEQKNKAAFILAVSANLAPLFICKYFNFSLENLNSVFSLTIPLLDIKLPIGISFYTFQMLTYIIDLYRGNVARQKDPAIVALYIFLFPQLIAGPIVRYCDVEAQLMESRESWPMAQEGAKRFIKGLAKKIIIADSMGKIVSAISGASAQVIGPGLMWLCILSYTMQIYFDFSGYSDMAIGLGKIFGIDFLENFLHPYYSLSVTEFWRRWHISMSTFFRDYIYIPMGGNRVSRPRWIFNILFVWFLTGLWHGAHWNFVCWGLYYAVLLVLEKVLLGKVLEKLPRVIRWAYTFFLTMIGWTLFIQETNSFTQMVQQVGRLFTSATGYYHETISSLGIAGYLPYLLLALLLATPTRKLFDRLAESIRNAPKGIAVTGAVLHDVGLVAIFALCLVFICIGSSTYFLYFNF